MEARIEIQQEVMYVELYGQIVRLSQPIKALAYNRVVDFGKNDNLLITIPQIPRALLVSPEEARDE